jgi:hypothetical protein
MFEDLVLVAPLDPNAVVKACRPQQGMRHELLPRQWPV